MSNVRLRRAIVGIFLLTVSVPGLCGTRYVDEVFKDLDTRRNIPYSFGDSAFYLDMYEPAGDTATMRPLILFVHGGGFSHGDKEGSLIGEYARELAYRGYLVGSMNYRLGDSTRSIQGFNEGMYRVISDMKAAIRFLCTASGFEFDTGAIYAGGESAGAISALHYACWESDEITAAIDTTELKHPVPMDGPASIHAVFGLWGGTPDTNWLDGMSVPVALVHGTADTILPYDTGGAYNLDSMPYYGSAAIHRVLTRAGTRCELMGYEGMGHGHYGAADKRRDTTLTFLVNFFAEIGNHVGTRKERSPGRHLSRGPGMRSRSGVGLVCHANARSGSPWRLQAASTNRRFDIAGRRLHTGTPPKCAASGFFIVQASAREHRP